MQPIALLVGASSGIGYETAKKCRAKGYAVYNASRTPCDLDFVFNFTADVKNSDDLASAAAEIVKKTRRIDLLIYFAGASMAAPVEYAELGDLRDLFEVNYFGFIKAVQAVLPVMRAQNRGRIIAVGSMAGVFSIPYDGYYSGSKVALCSLLESLRFELYPFRIPVYAILPGGTKTAFTEKRKVYPAGKVRLYAGRMKIAVTRLAEMEQGGAAPENVAETIVRSLDRKNPPLVIASGFQNKFRLFLAKILPKRLVSAQNYKKYE